MDRLLNDPVFITTVIALPTLVMVFIMAIRESGKPQTATVTSSRVVDRKPGHTLRAPSARPNSEGLGLTVGAGGVDAHVDSGQGFGMDLTDGSLTIDLGGGFRLDTDGDGIKLSL